MNIDQDFISQLKSDWRHSAKNCLHITTQIKVLEQGRQYDTFTDTDVKATKVKSKNT